LVSLQTPAQNCAGVLVERKIALSEELGHGWCPPRFPYDVRVANGEVVGAVGCPKNSVQQRRVFVFTRIRQVAKWPRAANLTHYLSSAF
jgi:hypothetical protein